MRVNSSVKVVDEQSPHHGRAGVVNALVDSLNVVELDATTEKEAVQAEFRDEQLLSL